MINRARNRNDKGGTLERLCLLLERKGDLFLARVVLSCEQDWPCIRLRSRQNREPPCPEMLPLCPNL